jgi:hypothetical protein
VLTAVIDAVGSGGVQEVAENREEASKEGLAAAKAGDDFVAFAA